MTSIPVAVHGAAGRMGQLLVTHILQSDDLELVAAVESAGAPKLGTDAGVLVGLDETGIVISPDLGDASPEVVIDFSIAEAVPPLIDECLRTKSALIVCTTALADKTVESLEAAAHQIAVMRSPNMSLGVNLMFSIVNQVASILGDSADIELIEMHHRHKIDAPSGTAMRIAERIADGLGRQLTDIAIYGREGTYAERPRGQIGIHTLRGGDVPGDHKVIFASPGERLEITHKAYSRDVFAMGALRAARFMSGKPAGWYSMDQVLGLGTE